MRFSSVGKIFFTLFICFAVAMAWNVLSYGAITTFTATPSSGAAPLQVTFQIKGTGNNCGNQYNYEGFNILEFGDGTMYSSVVDGLNPTLQTITHTYSAIGTYTATFKAGCGNNNGIVDYSKTKTIHVEQPCSTAPTPQIVSPLPNVRVPTGESVSLNASALNPIGCIGLNYTWTLVSSPPGSTASILSPTSRITNFTPDVHGTYRLRLETTNESTLSNQTTVTITAFSEVDLSLTGTETSVPTAIGEMYALNLNVNSNKQLNNDSITVRIEAPANLTLSASPFRCSRSTSSDRQTLSCLGTMSGTSAALSVQAEVTEAGAFDINASVELAGSDLLEETNTSNNSASFQFNVALPTINGDLSVEVGADPASGLGLGDDVSFVVTASWAGPDRAPADLEGGNFRAQLLIDLSGIELARTPVSASGPIECDSPDSANVVGPNILTQNSISCEFLSVYEGSSSASVSISGVANYAGGANISASISVIGPTPERFIDSDTGNDSDSAHVPVVGALESDLAIASMTAENHLNGAGRFDGNMDIVIIIPAVSFEEPEDDRMDGPTINTYQLTLSANVRFTEGAQFSHDGPGSCMTTSDGAFVCELPYSESEQTLTFQFRGDGSYSPPTETTLVITAVVANLDEDAFDPNTDNNSAMIEVPLI